MLFTFKEYLAMQKKQFQKDRYEKDMQYQAVLFRQYGESYRWYCKTHAWMHEYDQIAYDVALYERRIQMYRNA